MENSKNGLKEPMIGVLTDSMDVSSSDFKNVQAILLNKSNNQDKWQKINIQLAAIRIQIEDYLHPQNPKDTVPVGNF